MVFHDLRCGGEKCGGCLGGYWRQILAPELGPRFATVPAVGLVRVGMNAIGDALLTIAEDFYFMKLAVRRDKLPSHLLEWRVGFKRNGAFRWEANTDGTILDCAFKQRLDLFGHLFVCYVDINEWHGAGKNAGVQMVGEVPCPLIDELVGGDNV